MHKHKGITIVELLGAIVIFSITSTIIAITISFIISANKQIVENGQANTAGTILIKNIENNVNDLFITRYDYTLNQSLILYSDFEFYFNEETSQIEQRTFDIPLQTSIIFEGDQLLIDHTPYALSPFILHESSTIEMISNAQFIITIVLASDEKTYTFKTNIIINL